VLAVMAVISWWTVKRGLRPLERIERTAEEIAEGNLSLRVAEPDPGTEVGRLGVAFNVMLERIEVTMEERRASEEALRRFLADASHELRTPLTSIRGYAELFRRGAESDPDDSALAIRRIEQESIRMGVLVDDLLFLARAGQGKPIASDPVDLAQIVDDATRDARVVDPTREIDLNAPAELTMMGDEGRLRQVITNLVSNAITHTAQGSAVAVSLEAEDGWAKIEVHDAGPGLTSEEAAHVFDPFYRAVESRSRQLRKNGEDRITGAGLGLSIVAAITQAHGGTVGVVSDPQRGSTFKVRLPLSRRESAP
jgi:two-component system OmpR family sensor kinase